MKSIEELANLPWFPLDYAGQGLLRRRDKAGDETESFIRVPSGAHLGDGIHEGDRVAQSIADATMLIKQLAERSADVKAR